MGYFIIGIIRIIITIININKTNIFPYKNKNIEVHKEENVDLLELYMEKSNSPTYIGNEYIKIPIEGSTYLEKITSIARTNKYYHNCFLEDYSIRIPVVSFNKEKIEDYLKQHDDNTLRNAIESNCDKRLILTYTNIPYCYIGTNKNNTFISKKLNSVVIDLALDSVSPFMFFSGFLSMITYLYLIL